METTSNNGQDRFTRMDTERECAICREEWTSVGTPDSFGIVPICEYCAFARDDQWQPASNIWA